jgi:aminoglycoside phosphotransferase (APT) family kinase protein
VSASDLAAGLERWLSELWGGEVAVEVLGESTAGARRQQVLFDAIVDGERRPLVATIVQQPELLAVSVEGEAESLLLAESAGVPVPHVHGYTVDEGYVGGPFFVSTRVAGESVPRRILRGIPSADAGEDLAGQCGAALGRLHSLPAERAHPDMRRPVDQNPAATALERMDETLTQVLQPMPVAHLALRWLRRNLPPPPAGHCVCHADFRNGNLIVDGARLAAVLDWESCHTGDPFEDLAWFCVRTWRFGNDDRMAGGFGSLDAFRAGYESAGHAWDEERFAWWYVFGTMRWAVGLAIQGAAHVRGEVRNIVMCASGRRVPELEYDTLVALGDVLGH